MEDYHKGIHKRSNGLSSKKTTRIDHTITNIASGSSIFGDSVNIQAGRDVKISGSEVLAVNDLDITAGNNIDIVAAKSTQDDYHMLKVEKTGFSTSGITGISYGKEMTKNTDYSHQEFYTASTVGSLNGNVNINAGGDVNVVGSAVQATTGDINIEGDNVNIVSAVAQSDFHNRFEYKKTGITVAVSGGIIDPLNTAYTYANIAKDAKTDQLKTMATIKTGVELNKAYENIPNSTTLQQSKDRIADLDQKIKTADEKINELKDKPNLTDAEKNDLKNAESTKSNSENAKEQEENKNKIQVTVTLGTQSYSSKQDTYTTTNYGSSITSGGNTNIKARGDQENGKEGDVTIQGSHVSGENVAIEAKDDVSILAAQDTQNTKGSNKSSGGSIGVTMGAGGPSVGVSINGGKGKNRGDGVENIESTIDARDTLTIISGGDTNIIGSQVKGDTVKAEIEGDLNIVSLQDTANSKDSQTNWSVSGSTTGAVSGSYSNQKFESNYKSVDEQAGIFAGSGGFDITVSGNTNLVGGVIASEATPDKNKLSTETITYSDIKNEAEWSTSTTGAGFSSGGENAQGKNKGLSPIIGGKDGEDSSTTKSAIVSGEIEVRSDPNKDLTDLSNDTANANNPLKPIFDRDKILEKEQAAALFGEMSADAIGKLAESKVKDAQKEYDKAISEGRIADANQIAQEAQKWEAGGEYKILLHTLAGGLMQGIGGGDIASGALGAGVIEYVHKYLDKNEKYGELDHGTRQIIAGILGGLVTQVITGNGKTGAESAINTEKNNHVVKAENVKLVIDIISDEEALMIEKMLVGKEFEGEEFERAIKDAHGKIMQAKDSAIYTEEQWQAKTAHMSSTELAVAAATPFFVVGGVILLVEGAPIFIAYGSTAYQTVRNLATSPVGQFSQKYIQQGNQYIGNSGPSSANSVRNLDGGNFTDKFFNATDYVRTFSNGVTVTFRATSSDGTPVVQIAGSGLQWLLNQKIL
jgi:filamentous hemagglutinin